MNLSDQASSLCGEGSAREMRSSSHLLSSFSRLIQWTAHSIKEGTTMEVEEVARLEVALDLEEQRRTQRLNYAIGRAARPCEAGVDIFYSK